MKRFNFLKIFLLACLISLVGILLYRYLYLLPDYKQYGRYSIGKVINTKIKMKGSIYTILFEYEKKGRVLNSSSSIQINENPQKIVNKRFLVIYLSNKENHADILLEYPIPDSIKTAPPTGWKELPEWAKIEKK